jgi:DNA-binding transcriptional regulator YiaG
MGKKYQSELDMVIYEMAQDLYEIGAIDETEMREFDEDCLVPDDSPDVETDTLNESEEDSVLIHA